jgi:uracil-DNA glycosylase
MSGSFQLSDFFEQNVPNALEVLRKEAATCRACPLWKNATQTVFGEGPPHAKIMLIGEQPGDKEDLAGHPFIGPAGQLLDRALEEARRTYRTARTAGHQATGQP